MKTITPQRKPLPPDEHYSRMVEIRREISKFQTWPNKTMHPSLGLVHYVCAMMDNAIGRENRNKLLSESFRRVITSSKDLTAGEQMGLLLWAAPVKSAMSAGEKESWHASAKFISDMEFIRAEYGQMELPNGEPK